MIQRGITVKRLAYLTGLTPTTISYVRNGRNVHMSTIHRCANALKCKPIDIIGYTMFDFDEYDRQMAEGKGGGQ